MTNGPVTNEVDGEDLDAINELQFKFDKKNKELDKVGLLLLFLWVFDSINEWLPFFTENVISWSYYNIKTETILSFMPARNAWLCMGLNRGFAWPLTATMLIGRNKSMFLPDLPNRGEIGMFHSRRNSRYVPS